MKKSNLATLLVFLLAVPATLYLGSKMSGRWYYLTSTLIVIELLIPFFLAFEGRKPQARELVVIAVMCALAVAARVAVPIPNFKAIYGMIMIAGIAFGPESGFLVGAVAALASNFFFSQGPYTPWPCDPRGAEHQARRPLGVPLRGTGAGGRDHHRHAKAHRPRVPQAHRRTGHRIAYGVTCPSCNDIKTATTHCTSPVKTDNRKKQPPMVE